MDNESIMTIIALAVAGLVALEKILNRGIKRDIREIKNDNKEIKQVLEFRKEENKIALDASEAAIDFAISLDANGKCRESKATITSYRNRCIEHRL